VDFVVEQTGYPPDIVELDADLEADLGIDSIKKAQLLGEIRELFSLKAEVIRTSQSANSSTMPEFRTLREIRDSLLAWTANSNSEVAESHTQGVLSAEDTPSGKDRVEATSDERVASQQDDTVSQQATLPQSKRELNVEADELPTVAWNEQKDGKCSIATSQLFVDSARCNLKALVARRSKIGFTGEGNLGSETEWYSRRSKCFADALGCNADSLRLFDEALNSEGGWNFDSATDSSQSGPILWLCGLRLPVWLQHVGGTSLSLIQHCGVPSVTELLPAGALLPLATIIGERLLVVVRINSSSESSVTERQTLSRLMLQFEGHSLESLADRLRQQNVKSEWQLLAVDRVTRESFVARSSGHEIQIDFGRPRSVFDAPDCHPGWSAAIGLEQRSGNFVVWSSRGYSSLASPLQVSLKNAQIEQLPINLDEPQCSKPDIASRYALKLVPSPARKASEPNLTWGETALVVGDNGVAQQLESRLRKDGVEVIRFSTYQDPAGLAADFRRLTREKLVAHLFLTTPLDVDAETRLETDHWTERRNQGILGPYWLCQQWLSHIVEMQLTDHASLVAVTALGGDFGIESKPYSIEGGGLAGLLKSMLVESWTQGYRPLTIKVLDTVKGEEASQIVDHIWQELEVPSYDIEISYSKGGRHVLRALESSIVPARPGHQPTGPTPGGVWICTGGARGITAYVAEQLAKRYQLKLHLIGKSGVPEVQPEWRELDSEGLRDLKIKVMTEARNSNQSPLETWQSTEKALEIDETLRRLRAEGIEAHYHSCDVADSVAVLEIVDRIRQQSGAIRGVLHGAGVGKDSRFDRKQVEKVEQCISAKVDGAMALMEATRQDPLEFFIGFGSISGRFGANGHTDYSLANDMLCKLIDWYARLRPEVRSVGFHWHAWGDVGMATKPETRLALEMVDMQFMPAAEGVKHLIDELESGAEDSEVLITDDRYYRMFYPDEHLLCEANQAPGRPEQIQQAPYDRQVQGCLLTSQVRPVSGGTRAFEARVNPSRDPFLTEHLLHGKPLMPFVVATEMLWEAASLTLSTSDIDLYSIEAISGIRFFHEAEQGLRVETAFDAEGDIQCQLFNDFISRSGRLIETDRMAFRATAKLQNNETPLASDSNACVRLTPDKERKWRPVSYPPADADFYVGWPLQRLRSVQLQGDGIIGRISAPALIELAGSRRQVAGWKVPSAAMDACLFAVGMLAWEHVAAGVALPVRIGLLSLGDRLPDPGEACQVHAKFKRAGDGRAVFDFSLYGIDDQLLLNAQDYEVAWLDRQEASSQSANSEVVAREDRRS
jgi:NAD(P)-dependent dehydrogenase (short-subunit alcohol dehydrogenase family)/acyl carrier protein